MVTCCYVAPKVHSATVNILQFDFDFIAKNLLRFLIISSQETIHIPVLSEASHSLGARRCSSFWLKLNIGLVIT